MLLAIRQEACYHFVNKGAGRAARQVEPLQTPLADRLGDEAGPTSDRTYALTLA